MQRLFQTHHIRKEIDQEGTWEFTPVEGENGEVFPATYPYRIPVPGCWEMHPDLFTYRGKGVYRKKVYVESESTLRFIFKGVSHTADVYFDGKKVAHHYNAYTPFEFLVSSVAEGEHELVVFVDNSFSEDSVLHFPNDYYTYGGIIRSVSMEAVPDTFIERVWFLPFMEENTWKANISVFLKNTNRNDTEVEFEINLADQIKVAKVVVPAEGETVCTESMVFHNVKQWDQEDPFLYMLKVQLFTLDFERPVDDLMERVGFRKVSIEGRNILVNGRKVFLKGFNRHEDHGMVGAAFPLQLMVKDLDLIEDMGANAVRTSHYPYDERFLDLCDERGIFVWEENHARGIMVDRMRNPLFAQQCEDCIREMINNHYNHPSIIIWAILNECASNEPEGREHYKRQLEQIRRMDGSRPVTYATCHHFSDICLDLADIISVNIYTGWYDNDGLKGGNERVLEKFLEEKEWIEKSGAEGKPIIISEFGVEALRGYREPGKVKWSEERQADILDQNLSVYLHRDEICGALIWQFCDCRVTDEGSWFKSRARTKNNKGIVDEYRRPKLSYYTVQKHYRYRS